MDKSGEKRSNKKSCGSPNNPNMCLFLGLGMNNYMISNDLGRKDFSLSSLGSKIGTAAKRLGEPLSKLMEKFEVVISSCTNPKKGNTHGVRKGSSTNAATGTTRPLLW